MYMVRMILVWPIFMISSTAKCHVTGITCGAKLKFVTSSVYFTHQAWVIVGFFTEEKGVRKLETTISI